MVNIRLQSIIRKEFIQIIRDPRTLILIIFIPIMQLLLMGYAATTDVRNVPLAIFDQDRGREARALLDAYRAADYFHLAYDVDSIDEILSLIDQGDAKAGLIIPPDYSTQLAGKGTAQIAFVLDGSDPTIASTSLSAAQLIAQAHSHRTNGGEPGKERAGRRGRLMAVGTPTELKEREVAGAVWRVHCSPLLASLDLLETLPIVRNVSLSGNHLRAITEEKSSAQNLEKALDAAGLRDVRIQETAPTLEDVFLSLAGN